MRVTIDRAVDGTATITLQAEKSATLQALQQDAAHLHQALDRAGLPAEGRQISFGLNQDMSAPATPTPPGAAAGNTGTGAGFTGGSDGQRGGHTPPPPAQSRPQSPTGTAEPQPRPATARPSQPQAGLNITA